MMGFEFFTASINLFRKFSSTTSSKASKYSQYGNKKVTKYKEKRRDPKIKWTEEQKDILVKVRNGLSLFITGSAGTGKTVLLKQIINILRKAHGPSGVFVTASTGVAACALKGQTLHSFAGIGINSKDRQTLLERVSKNKRTCGRWRKVNALVIDEISMIDAKMFENLEYIAKEIRGSGKVWGGIQLIVCGDFYQLPPIIDRQSSSGIEFAFEADCWDASFDVQVELTKVLRQSDPGFIKLLNGIRKGVFDSEDLKLLGQCCSRNEPDSSVVRLYPRIKDVKKVNEERMKSLGEKIIVYKADDGGMENRLIELNKLIVPDRLELCKGASVVLIKNLNPWKKLCNGATGIVTGFVKAKDEEIIDLTPDNLLPVVKFDVGKEIVIKPQIWEIFEGDVSVAWRLQIPLTLAWALSIHKCQGMTLDHLHTDISKCFAHGHVYVSISRVKKLEGLYLSGFDPSVIKVHPKVSDFYERLSVNHRVQEANIDDVD